MYQNRLLGPGVQNVVNRNKIKFEPYSNLADEAYSRYNAKMLESQDPFTQIENDETGEAVCSDDQDDENTDSNINSAVPIFMPRIMVVDEILKSINFLNSKQRDVFNIVHNWAKEYAKQKGANVKPAHIFFSGSGGEGKLHLVKTIYNDVSKILLLSLAVNIGGQFMFVLGITPRAKLSG